MALWRDAHPDASTAEYNSEWSATYTRLDAAYAIGEQMAADHDRRLREYVGRPNAAGLVLRIPLKTEMLAVTHPR